MTNRNATENSKNAGPEEKISNRLDESGKPSSLNDDHESSGSQRWLSGSEEDFFSVPKKGVGEKRALLVGINNYAGEQNDLPSCVTDVARMKQVLEREFMFDEVISLTDGQATLNGVREALDRLFTNVSENDRLVFYYSGHGYRYKVAQKVTQEVLVLIDGYLQDDELATRSQRVPPGVLTVILDACYSGGMEKLFLETAQVISKSPASLNLPLPFQAAATAVDSTFSQNAGKIKSFIEQDLSKFISEQQIRLGQELKPFGSPKRKYDEGRPQNHEQILLNNVSDEPGELALNGLLFSASREDETAAASTPFSDGLSAFTYALTKAISVKGINVSSLILVQEIIPILRKIGAPQTPQIKEPGNPKGAASLSFIGLGTIENNGQPPIQAVTAGGEGDAVLAQFLQTLIARFASTHSNKRVNHSLKSKEIQHMDSQSILPLLLTTFSQGAVENKGQQEKIFGIDDAILIPAILSIVTAATKSKSVQRQKLFGIDDAILIPALVSVVSGFLSKNKSAPQEKIAGIDDAILIPALASLVTTLIRQF